MKDIIREWYNKAEALINRVKPLNSLIDEDGVLKTEFKANGTIYQIKRAEEIFTIEKSNTYEKLIRQFSHGKTPSEYYKFILDLESKLLMMSSQKSFVNGFSDIIRLVHNAKDSFKAQQGKMGMAYYIASLFIIKKGADPYESFSFEGAEEKIKDWCIENINPQDFFLLVLSTSNECKKIIKDS